MIYVENDQVIVTDTSGQKNVYDLGSPEAFEIISQLWLRAGWDNKYVYTFTWLGRPIIQLPEDMFRLQEVIYQVQPDVIIETGIAHGGGLVFYASLCQGMGKGRVVGVDIEIRPHNRAALETHALSKYITLIEGSSTDPQIVEQVKSHVKPGEKVIVLLDSNHKKDHVLQELELYSPLVTVGSYIVAMDGIMEQVVGAPRTSPEWVWNNPKQAAHEFVTKYPNFVIQEPPFAFNEGTVKQWITYWPDGFIRRIG